MLNINDYNFGKVIARTERSSVFLASNKHSSQKVAVKCYKIPSRSSPEYLQIVNELVILSKCSHTNIVKFYGFCEKTHKDEVLNEDFLAIYLIMESLDINLKELLKSREKLSAFFSLQELKKFICEIFSVFLYFEKESLVHQDIKPMNIMINTDKTHKIVDVSTAKNLFGLDLNNSSFNVEGTLLYSSPEKLSALLKNQGKFAGNLNKSDVFSFGLVLLQMASLKKIKGLNNGDKEAESRILARIDEIEERYNKTLGRFLKVLLEKDEKKRPSFNEIRKENFDELFAEELHPNSNNAINNSKNSQIHQKKLSFHSVNSSDIQSISQINESPFLREIDGNSNEIEILLRNAEKYQRISQYDKSIELYEKCFKLKWKGENPEEDLQTGSILSGLAVVCLELSNHKKAEELFEKSLIIRRRLVGEYHKITADSYNSLGVSLHGQGLYEKAVENFVKSMEIYEKLFGVNDKNTVLAYINVAGGHCLLGNHEKALNLRKLALEIKVKLYGENSEEVAGVYDELADELKHLGKLEETVINRVKGLEIRKRVFGEKHVQTASSLMGLAGDFLEEKNYDKGLINSEESLKIRMDFYGENHVETARSYQQAGECYLGIGELKKSEENFEKAYNIRRNLLGEEHEETEKSKRDLKEISVKLKFYS